MSIKLKADDDARGHPLRWLVFAAFATMLFWSCRAFVDFGELFLELKGKNFLERGSIGASEWQCFLTRAGIREREQIFSRTHRELALATQGGVEPAKVILWGYTINIVNPRARWPSRTMEPITVVRSEQDLPSEVLSKGSAAMVRSEKEFASDLEDCWLWTVELGSQLPSNARVFLNEPSLTLYYFSTFMWYPRQVDVATQRKKITDRETLDAVFKTDPSRLDLMNLKALEEKLRPLGYTHLAIRRGDQRELLSLRSGE